MNRLTDSKSSGSIRRNSPSAPSQQLVKFSQQFLKQRLKNRQKLQSRMKDLNTKLYSSQSDLIKQSDEMNGSNPEVGEQRERERAVMVPRSPRAERGERKYYEQEKVLQKSKEKDKYKQLNKSQIMSTDKISQLLKQMKQQHERDISSLKRTHQMKLKAMDQVVLGKDKIIKELEIQNGMLRTQLARLQGCLKNGRLL